MSSNSSTANNRQSHAVETTSRQSLQHIAGDEGWPLVGLLPKYFYSLNTLVQSMQERYGTVARMRIPGSVGLFVFGADNHQRIFLDKERIFSSRLGLEGTLGPFFKGALLLKDFDDHRFQRRMMQGAFKTPAMRQYPKLMNSVIATELDSWSGRSIAQIHPLLKTLLLKISAQTFFGIAPGGEETEKLSQQFNHLVDASIAMFRCDIPGFAYHRGLRSRQALEQYFKHIIPLRRGGDGADMLSHMSRETSESGELFRDDDIANQAIFLLFAAHDTTTSVLNNLLLHLGSDQQLQQRLRAESQALNSPQLDYDDLDALVTLDHCIDECLRLYPPAPLSVRSTLKACEIDGIKIPAYTTLYLPMMANHRAPQFWTDPERFDPDRFAIGREEHKRHSFAFHPFGGGAHKCIGMHFARMMAKCVMHQLLLSQRISIPDGYRSRHLWIPLPRPVKLPITLTPL